MSRTNHRGCPRSGCKMCQRSYADLGPRSKRERLILSDTAEEENYLHPAEIRLIDYDLSTREPL